MPPKTPNELKEQLDQQNEDPPADDQDRTAEGLEVPRPSREDFFSNLEKAGRPPQTD
jgi:hypothetical protein